MSINTIGQISNDNFQLISSVTPTAGAASVSFTSLNRYSKLLLVVSDCALATSGRTFVRLNNDSSAVYLNSVFQWVSTSTTINVELSTSFRFGTATGTTNVNAAYLIENCNTTGAKQLTRGFDRIASTYGANPYQVYTGAAAVVSQIDFLTSTTFSATGTVYLYGAK